MSTAITKTEPQAIATVRVQAMRTALDEESAIRGMVKEYVNKHMVAGTDYGVIPGTDKPTLLKPGAQKLISLFRCKPTYRLISKTQDFEHNLFSYIFRVRLVSRDTKEALAEGYGSANSREGRYRWRNAARKCPHCKKEAIIKGKAEYGGGWLCFDKKGGCRAKFSDGDPSIESQAQGQVENDDVATLDNTIMKMAKKRAEVDGAIALAHCADMFTQDLEDLPADEPIATGRVDAQPQASVRETPREPAKPSGRVAAARAKAEAKLAETKPAAPTEPHVEPVDGEEEIILPFRRFSDLARKHGKSPFELTQFASGVLNGKTSGYSHADIDQVEAALGAVSK